MAQVADDGNLRALTHLHTYLIVYISKDGLAGRAHLCVVQRTLGLGQALAEDAQVEFLHLVFGSQHLLLVLVLLTELFQFQLGHVDAQFGLTHLVGRTRTEAVQILLVAQLHLHAVQLHFGHLDLHGQVLQLGFVVHLQLLQFVGTHLFLVKLFLVLGLGTLQVEFQDGRTYVHTVAPLLVHLKDAGIDGRIDDFLECRHHLARSTDTDLNRSLIDLREDKVLFFHSRPHQRDEDTDDHDTRSGYDTVTDPLLVALLAAHLFRNFSIHRYLFLMFIFSSLLRPPHLRAENGHPNELHLIYMRNPCQKCKSFIINGKSKTRSVRYRTLCTFSDNRSRTHPAKEYYRKRVSSPSFPLLTEKIQENMNKSEKVNISRRNVDSTVPQQPSIFAANNKRKL